MVKNKVVVRPKEYGKLGRKLVGLLAQRPTHTVNSLMESLRNSGASYSVQAVYHVLRKLRREGVAVRMTGKFSLSLPWALELIELAKTIEHKFVRDAPLNQLLPAELSRRSWVFQDLFTLDDVWVQLMLTLLAQSTDKTIFNYCPHPWFYFSQRSKMERFYRVLLNQSAKIYLIIGGSSRLDRLFSDSMPRNLYSCTHLSPHSNPRIDQHRMVIGDYVLKVQLPLHTAKKIDQAFIKATKGTESDMLAVQNSAQAITRARLRVAHSPIKARQERKWLQGLLS